MANPADVKRLVELLNILATNPFWDTLRSHLENVEKCRADARDWHEYARNDDHRAVSAEAAKEHAQDYEQSAEVYRQAAIGQFNQYSEALHMLARLAPELLGHFPNRDWETSRTLDPLDTAQKFLGLLGLVIAKFQDAKAPSKYDRPYAAWLERLEANPTMTSTEFCRWWNTQQQLSSNKITAGAWRSHLSKRTPKRTRTDSRK